MQSTEPLDYYSSELTHQVAILFMALSAKALEGYSIREALCTAIKFGGDGRMPKDGQVVGLSTCRWDANYAPAAVVSSALRSEIPDDLRGAFTGDAGSLLLPLPRDLNRAAITQDNTGAQLVDNSLQTIVDALRPLRCWRIWALIRRF